jgi:DNA replicative helicase MCM subunit Mcm2 (Cdc46/Mcm family)
LEALTVARTIVRVQMTEETRARWNIEYPALVKSGTNLTDHITARAEAQVVRLALVYALLDQAPAIEITHLEAALALWRFCQASTRYVFGDLTGDSTGDAILKALRAVRPDGLAKQDIFALFGRNLAAAKIDAALGRLQIKGKTVSRMLPTGGAGRPRQMWYAL